MSMLDANECIQTSYSDSQKALQVLPVSVTTFYNGQVTVVTSGSAVQLSTQTGISSVVIKAVAANTGKAYIGVTGVTTSNGFELSAGDAVTLAVNSLADIYVNADTNSTKVCWIAS